MSFLAASQGVLRPEELSVVRSVFDRVASEPWISKEPAVQEALAKFVLNMYERGMCYPDKLYPLCLAAARRRFGATSGE